MVYGQKMGGGSLNEVLHPTLAGGGGRMTQGGANTALVMDNILGVRPSFPPPL